MTKVIHINHEHVWEQGQLPHRQATLTCTVCGLWVYDKKEENKKVVITNGE